METLSLEEFEKKLADNKATSEALRAEWLAFEKAASGARRAYFASTGGGDTVSKVAGLARRFGPLAAKYLSAGGAGALLSNPEGILSAVRGILSGIVG